MSDYVIPPRAMYERADLPVSAYGFAFFPAPWVQYSPQLLDPPEGSDLTEEWYFFWALAKRLGKSIEFGGVKLDTETAPVLEDLLRSRAQHPLARSEEHTSELQSLMRISYAVFCLKKKNTIN